ncbi:hypothetical protein BDD12DRAFT_103935 [Trichophaea hybrida]|nr:hypothetical protein BDD12DRAFT_103935 [Trichophaea hybrida]
MSLARQLTEEFLTWACLFHLIALRANGIYLRKPKSSGRLMVSTQEVDTVRGILLGLGHLLEFVFDIRCFSLIHILSPGM